MVFENFMLPTQAADAIILDGSILILVGVFLSVYLLYTNRQNILDTSLLPAADLTEDPVAHQYEFEYNENIQTEAIRDKVVDENVEVHQSQESEEEFEEEYIKHEEGQKILIK